MQVVLCMQPVDPKFAHVSCLEQLEANLLKKPEFSGTQTYTLHHARG